MMRFNELKPGERFYVLDTPKVDKYTSLSVFLRYGSDSKKRLHNANAIDIRTEKEYEFVGDEKVKVQP